MLGLFLKGTKNAIEILKLDHTRVKELFNRFEKTHSRLAKIKIANEAITELKAHAVIEEEIFYPAVRRKVGDDIMNEADEEHHVAKVLIAELDSMNGRESHYDSKFIVLAENVRHHIKEEEGDMLPKAEEANLDFEALGEKMLKRKNELLRTGHFPRAGEEAMVAASHGQGDSPAKASHRHLRVKHHA